MSYSADSPYVHWICPEERGQLSITDIHFPKRLITSLRAAPFEIKVNTDFEGVIAGCAEATPTRPETWINTPIMETFIKLHHKGHAHSVECHHDGELVGGVYGLSIGGAFFGESMFSRSRDASKIALAHLVARLWKGGYKVLDTQFVNDHLKQFGVYELAHAEYKKRLDQALLSPVDFLLKDYDGDEDALMGEYLAMRKGQKTL